MNNPYLHIYSQEMWHGAAFIVGNAEALLALRDAIDRALGDNSARAEVFTNDGEGYFVAVAKLEAEEEYMALALPYTDEIAKDQSEDSVWPWQHQFIVDMLRKPQE